MKTAYSQETKLTSSCLQFVRLAICLIMFFGIYSATQASSDVDAPEFDLPSYKVEAFGKDLNPPKLDKVVIPIVSKSLIGAEVTMTFRILKDGRVAFIRSNAQRWDDNELNLASIMHNSLRDWRFSPAIGKDGNPVAIKVALPVQVVRRKGNAHQYASLGLKNPVILAVLDR